MKWYVFLGFLYLFLFGCKLSTEIKSAEGGSGGEAPKPILSFVPTQGSSSELPSLEFSTAGNEDFFLNLKDQNGNVYNANSITWVVVSGPAAVVPASDSLSALLSSVTAGSGVVRVMVDGVGFDVNYTVTAPAGCSGGPTVFTTNMNARNVIGQADFASSAANRGGSIADNTLSNPLGVWVKDGKLYISDAGNNRILVYNSIPTTDGASADSVIGQGDFLSGTGGTSAVTFSGNQGLAMDDTYLAVAEWSNRRVTFRPISSLATATLALGQDNLVSGSANKGGSAGQDTLNSSVDVALTSNKVIVSDSGNRRVLVYDKSSLAMGMNASAVLGQPDYLTTTAGSPPSKNDFPLGVATDGTKLVVTDGGNNAVMVYNDLSSVVSGMDADSVAVSGYGQGANQLNNPVSSFLDGDRLFVADRGNDRILIFNSFPDPGDSADVILGQNGAGSGDHNQCSCSTAAANTLWGVHFMYWDGCRLIVADTQNNRVLIY